MCFSFIFKRSQNSKCSIPSVRLPLQYKLKRCAKKEYCKQCRYVKCTMTKWPVHGKTHRITQKLAEHQDATDNEKTLVFVFFGC